MPVEETHELDFPHYLLGAPVVIAFDLMLLYLVSIHEVNTWWYFVTVIIAFVTADGINVLLDKMLKPHINQNRIPILFALFSIVVLSESLAANYVTQHIAIAFNSPDTLAYIAFFGLNLVPTAVLYYDFLMHYKFRRKKRPTPQYD